MKSRLMSRHEHRNPRGNSRRMRAASTSGLTACRANSGRTVQRQPVAVLWSIDRNRRLWRHWISQRVRELVGSSGELSNLAELLSEGKTGGEAAFLEVLVDPAVELGLQFGGGIVEGMVAADRWVWRVVMAGIP